jgi:GNAT superfamily N-acetyltransferase
MSRQSEFETAVSVFVEGFCAGKSLTHPYESKLIEGVWALRDAERRNPRSYRKEEYIAWDTPAHDVDRIARDATRGWYFVGAFLGDGEEEATLRSDYKKLGYRLLSTEPFFVHDLARVGRVKSPARIECVCDEAMDIALGKATRCKPLGHAFHGVESPIRQYAAFVDDAIVGSVRSVRAMNGNWVQALHVAAPMRRRGIGTALLQRLLRDDRKTGAKQSVLLASHTGALLYPHAGYKRIGTLYIFAPKRPT